MSDVRAKAAALAAELRAMDEPERKERPVLSEFRRRSRELIEETERDLRQREIDEAVEKRMAALAAEQEAERKAKAPPMKPRSRMTTAERAAAVRRLGPDKYLELPW